MAKLTSDEIQTLNEWARTQPALRKSFPYTASSDVTNQGLGTKLSEDTGDFTGPVTAEAFYIESDGEVASQNYVNAAIAAIPATPATPGFYGIIIRESDGSFVERDDTIEFDSSDFNVADVADKPRVTIVDSGIDHGSIGGLADNDHPQYVLKTEQSPGFYGIIFTDGVNAYRTDELDVNANHFYFSRSTHNRPVLNLRNELVVKSFTLQSPSKRDTITWFVADRNLHLEKMDAFLRTADSGFYPFCDFSIRRSPSIPTRGSGTEVTTGGWRIGFYTGGSPTATENPLNRLTFTNPNILMNDWVWVETTNIGEGFGVEQELHITVGLT